MGLMHDDPSLASVFEAHCEIPESGLSAPNALPRSRCGKSHRGTTEGSEAQSARRLRNFSCSRPERAQGFAAVMSLSCDLGCCVLDFPPFADPSRSNFIFEFFWDV